MALSNEAVVAHLQQMLPADRVVTDEAELRRSSVDNFRKLQNIFGVHTMRLPLAVVHVASTDEVSAVLKFADEHGVNVVARTGGTATEGGLESGAPQSIVVDGSMLNQIISIDPYNMQATAQCGVPLQLLEDKARELGLTTGHSPQSKPIASMGGLVATRSIGQFSTLYGGIEDMVVGCEVVFPGGQVSRIKNVPRRAAGPDIRHIVIGNEGALCYITEVTVKLIPLPAPPCTAVAYFPDLPSAGDAILQIFREGFEPSLMEIVDQACLRQVNAVYGMGLDTDAACLLLIQSSGDRAEWAIERMAALCVQHGATEVHHVADPAEGDMFVEVRRRVWPAFERLGKAMLPEDVAVPRERLAELLAGIVEIGERHRVALPTIGHAGDGNMHPLLVFDGNDADEAARAQAAFADIVALALSLGGTIAGEHGVGTLKRRFVEQEVEAVHLGWQHRVKATFDPTGMLNPGKAL